MRKIRTIAEQHADSCIHFTGIQNEKCGKNIKYPDDVRKLPCNKRNGLDGLPPCDDRHFPTEEEIAVFVEEHEKHFEKMKLAFQIVARIKKEHKGEGWSGIETCPACGGRLHLSHAALNGHVWGKCETKDCLGWME